MKIKKVSVDTSRVKDDLDHQLNRTGKARPQAVGVGGLPFDLPMYVTVERLIYSTEDHNPPKMFSSALHGHLITLDFWLTKTIVEIRILRDPARTITIKVDGKRLFKKKRGEDDFPATVKDAIERIVEEDGRWVEQVTLQPGDDVSEGPNGEMVITRASDLKTAKGKGLLRRIDEELSEELGIPRKKLYKRKNGKKPSK